MPRVLLDRKVRRASIRRWRPVFLAIALAACGRRTAPARPSDPTARVALAAVGAARCVACHPAEALAWHGSQHALALQAAHPDTVRGAFDGRAATGMGERAIFSRDGDRFVVRTAGADGAPASFEVRWTLGVYPLQQYLVPMANGAWQVLPFAWDTRLGHGRWFPMHPGETVLPGDPLYWTGSLSRWNTRCAECHSTGLRRGYEPATGTWATTWTDEDVSCEACHGAGSRHVAWAEAGAPAGFGPALPVHLSSGRRAVWTRGPGERIARRTPARTDHVELDTCSRCHSRRTTLVEGLPTGAPLLDTHRPEVLAEGLYQPDGQVLAEDYVWGSFVQSRMYAAGVTCTDCHDPHTTRLKAKGDALCTRCHDPAAYAVPSHDHHAAGKAPTCADCHMPPRTYMVVDARRDHSFRVPRPDLSVSMGVSEPCTGCHPDRDAAWAAAEVRAWFPHGRAGTSHYGEALYAGRTRAPDAPKRLADLASDPGQPAIARATAVSLLPRYPTPGLPALLRALAADADPLVRREVAEAAGQLPVALRPPIAAALLHDPVRGVREEAADALAEVPDTALSAAARGDRAGALAELRRSLALSADTPEARVALAHLDRAGGHLAAAEQALRAALSLDPDHVPARVNLADVLREEGRDTEAEALLTEGIARRPAAALYYARAMCRVRLGDRAGALDDLRRAVALGPREPRYAYGLAVALSSRHDLPEARAVAAAAYAQNPGDTSLLDLLESLARDAGDARAEASWHARRREDAPWSTR